MRPTFQLLALFMSAGLLAQVGTRVPDFRIYVLGDSDDRYCAFNRSDRWNSEKKSRAASEMGTLTYPNGNLGAIQLQYVDDTGDWSVDETYRLNSARQLISLSRIITVRDGDVHESWLIKNGKATKQPSPKQSPAPDFVPDLPVVTQLDDFPFWALIRDHEREIRSKGMACTAEGGPPPDPRP
jgi:hypothetical protein